MSVILEELRKWKQLSLNPKQQQWFDDLLDIAKVVEVVRLADVFNDREIEQIRRVVGPEVKGCYRNSHLLTLLFTDRVQYVEGQTYTGVFGIDHAFNRIGDKYVDITFELAFNDDPTQYEYVAFEEYPADVIQSVTEETGYYGEVYRHLYIEKMRNPRT